MNVASVTVGDILHSISIRTLKCLQLVNQKKKTFNSIDFGLIMHNYVFLF